MYLKSVELKNFRAYEQLSLKLDKQLTVLVGVNGSGKTALLDSIATALGSFIAGLDAIPSNGINPEDARRISYELGSRIEQEAQYPVEICAWATFSSTSDDVHWKRSLHGKKGRTHIKEAKSIMDIAKYFQECVRKGDEELLLPLLAYYGTGRLYLQRKGKRDNSKYSFRRLDGYLDALNSVSNEKRLIKWFERMSRIEQEEDERIPELEAIKNAMARCFGGDSRDKVTVSYSFKSEEIEISQIKNGNRQKLPLRLLSDGEKIVLSMVADIAHRMAVLNPQLLDKVLDSPGIVLIDEIDLHLHPSWQARILDDLQRVFPKVQFIVTTHSPTVLTNVRKENIRLLSDNQVFPVDIGTYGRNISDILGDVMGVNPIPSDIRELKNMIYQLIDKNDFETAEKRIDDFAKIVGSEDAQVVSYRTTLELERFIDDLE